jgi:hypothetical protein
MVPATPAGLYDYRMKVEPTTRIDFGSTALALLPLYALSRQGGSWLKAGFLAQVLVSEVLGGADGGMVLSLPPSA